jgi:dihydrofolate reductase
MLSIIAVIGKNRELGCYNQLLWQLPKDMKRFRNTTSGHPVIMGRITFESIGKTLPKRTNIIISRNPKFEADNCLLAQSLDQAIALAEDYNTPGNNEIFIIGGGSIYKQAIKKADKLYLTIVDDAPKADTFFPEYKNFAKILKEESGTDNGYNYQYFELTKK